MLSQQGLYAYGLIGKSPEQLDIMGIDKLHKVSFVEGADIRVVVSDIDVDEFQNQVKQLFSGLISTVQVTLDETQTLLQAHEDVIDTLMKVTTIIPFKFGTILKDENAALELLQENEEKFKQFLARYVGKAEWGLKVYADTQDVIKYLVQNESKFQNMEEQRKKLSRGAAYLFGRKVENELKNDAFAQLASITEALFHEMEKDAYEARLNKTLPQKLTSRNKEMILNAAYLVEKESGEYFRTQGKKLQERYKVAGLELEISGPWPPYSFVDTEV